MNTKPKEAFILATGSDTGGAAIRVTEAFKSQAFIQNSEWRVRSMVATDNYIAYDRDLPWDKQVLEQTYDDADVVILNNTLHGHSWYDEGQGKPTIVMHHGLHEGHFDRSLQEVVAQAAQTRAYQIGSTVNLELYSRDDFGPTGLITWTPIPYDIQALAAMRVALFERHPTETIRIGHAPTDRAVKSTETVIAAVKSLQSRGFDVELVLIEHKTHAQTLETKARSVDIYVDQLKLGYGCNAIESWAMGIPVIAGFSDYPEWRQHAARRYECPSPTRMPFIETDEIDLENTLLTLITNRDMYDEWSLIGRDHVKRWHSQEFAVQQLSEVYEEASLQRTTPGGGPLSRRRRNSHFDRDKRLELLRANRALTKEHELSQQ